ncbi:MAG: hypothetical protein ACR2OZ_11180 [Verrucomicrobiales bacterium]
MSRPLCAFGGLIVALGCGFIGYLIGQRATPASGDVHEFARIDSAKRPGAQIDAGEAKRSIALPVLTPEEAGPLTARALSLPGRLERQLALAEIFARMTLENHAEVRRAFQAWFESGHRVNGEDAGMMKFRVGQLTGSKYIRLPTEPNGNVEIGAKEFFAGWASADPAGAKAWIEQLEPGRVRNELTAALVESAVETDPKLASEIYFSLPAGQQRALVDKMLSALTGRSGITAAQQWFGDLESGPLSGSVDPGVLREVYDNIAARLAQNHSDRNPAKQWLLEGVGKPWFSDRTVNALIHRLAADEPGESLNFLVELHSKEPNVPAEMVRNRVEMVITNSAKQSLNRIGAWLGENQNHALYDYAARFFAEKTMREDPVSAQAWAQTIKDEALRSEALKSVRLNQAAAQSPLEINGTSPNNE